MSRRRTRATRRRGAPGSAEDPRVAATTVRPTLQPDPRRDARVRRLADHLLVRWCQQSAPGEMRVAAPEPLVLSRALASDLTRSALALDRLLRRFADGLLSRDPALSSFALPDFPLAKDIYTRGPLGAPFFWGRFDIFERAANVASNLQGERSTAEREF